MSVRNSAVTAKDQYKFRKTADAMVPHKPGKIVRERIVTEDEFAFGVPTRPSTPMYGVMGNLYGRVAAEV
jgi:hypothetical protein